MKQPPPTTSFEQVTNRPDSPLFERHLHAHRSLSNRGFAVTILFTASALCIPLLAFLGTFALWTLLPFLGAALAALWYFIRRNDHDGTLGEHIRLWPDLIAVHRQNPRAPDQFWHANPYWVTVHMQDSKTVENYLTLTGGARDIELGSFLTPDARADLYRDLTKALASLR